VGEVGDGGEGGEVGEGGGQGLGQGLGVGAEGGVVEGAADDEEGAAISGARVRKSRWLAAVSAAGVQ
jgi:hypothetical protein